MKTLRNLSYRKMPGRRSSENGHVAAEGSLEQEHTALTAHGWDWEKNKDKDIYDDGTLTYFW
jgi:hypothetical protein